MSRRDTDPNRGNRKIPLTTVSAADLLGLNDDVIAPAEDPRGGDRAQPTEELLEAVARWCAWGYGGEEYAEQTGSNEHWRQVASELLALPAVAPLLDAQAAVERVREVCDVAEQQPDGYHFVATHLLRRALDGPS